MYSLDASPRPRAPHLPDRGGIGMVCQAVASAALHLAAAFAIVASFRSSAPVPAVGAPRPQAVPIEATHLVFLASAGPPGTGGGGGGNRQTGPIRQAEGIGHDRVTLRVAKPRAPAIAPPGPSPD